MFFMCIIFLENPISSPPQVNYYLIFLFEKNKSVFFLPVRCAVHIVKKNPLFTLKEHILLYFYVQITKKNQGESFAIFSQEKNVFFDNKKKLYVIISTGLNNWKVGVHLVLLKHNPKMTENLRKNLTVCPIEVILSLLVLQLFGPNEHIFKSFSV